ncbi:MAG: transcription antitermination factor NusB, partial [Alphaproteobacteria bacterium]|nr:transcription antitermination factor NusB [Alphaproteobacteria bacterium]
FIRHRLGAIAGDGFEDGRVPDAHVPLFTSIVRTATAQQETIDGMIAESLPADWPLDRLDPVLRALLRAGAAELWMKDGPPTRVVINEYLDVAHGFFDGDAPKLANGVLDRIAHILRPAEFGDVTAP